ncbi:MAG TPA: zincin-like metallopeptidase domain-containing protein [Saprospiraceae bacterium]|nr:zincin-like metallopeptidase domain-containing protein [Saprospiraceae bacterium]
MNTQELYQKVTNTIIELLESHLEDWSRPWIAFGQDQDFARNAKSGIHYRGINQFLLSFIMLNKGYLKNTWLTFDQVKQLGGNIIKGEKASPIVFFKTGYMDNQNKFYSDEKISSLPEKIKEEKDIHSIPILKLYNVFNVAQTEKLDSSIYEIITAESLKEFEKDERAEALIFSTGAKIEILESNRAYYDRVNDKIRLPLREQFSGVAETFYSTALHELGHWTGHPSRLNREGGKKFGDIEYSKEELIAELTSAFCASSLGFSKTITQNASYIKNWLGILKTDNKAVVKVSYQAQKAADYIFELHKI